MSVHFKMIPKQNNLVSPPEVKYYPCAVSKGEKSLDDIASIIAESSSLSRADCFAVVIALSEVVAESLSDGYIVKLDKLGSFQLVLQGYGSEKQDTLGKSNIKSARVAFKPSKAIKSKIKNINYKRLR